MRIVGGSLKGRRLIAPDDRTVRPTSDRAREAIFNRLEHGAFSSDGTSSVQGARILDAFCGTGALGLEGLSRGGAHATFIDHDQQVIALVEKNIATLGVSARASVLRADATNPPRASTPCTLAFLDAPYADDSTEPALAALAGGGWLASGCLCVVERPSHEIDDGLSTAFSVLDSRAYGKARFSFLRYEASDPAD